MILPTLDRRRMLAGLAFAGAASALPARLAFAATAETDRRFVFVIQRGAVDGMSTLAPVGDPAFKRLRGQLAEPFADVPRISTNFALHPELKQVGEMFHAKQALLLHAVATPYRERSHFDAQNVLETGGTLAYQHKDGWMNRMLGLLPGGTRAMAVGPTVPAALRGPHDVSSYGNSSLPDANDDLLERVSQLYAGDAQLHSLWNNALMARNMAGDSTGNGRKPAELGELAARLMSGRNGARIAMIETGGWDTHYNQVSRLQRQFRDLDALLGALKTGLGADWNQTLVLVATEFGRTAAINGTQGTDHGTASMAMLLGGAVKGGRVMTDWPGLGQSQLYEARDLKPTIALDAAIAGAVGEHFALDPERVMSASFPGIAERPLVGLLA